MKNLFSLGTFILLGTFSINAQINTATSPNTTIAGENPFLDVSEFSDGFANNIGKGLVFPRTDLTQWTFKTDNLDGITFPTAFDGMIVYNTGSGSTLTGQGQVVSVTPGFYYFSNPGATDNITNGQWIKFEAGAAGGKFVDGTNPADAVYTSGNVGIGTATPSKKLTVKGEDAAILLENNSGNSKLAITYNEILNQDSKIAHPQIIVRSTNETIGKSISIEPGVGSSTDPSLHGGSVGINNNSGQMSSTFFNGFGGSIVRFGVGQNNGTVRREIDNFEVYSDRISLQGRLVIPEVRDYDNSKFKSSAALSFPGVTTAGLLPPKLTTAQMQALAPQSGLMVYNTSINCLMYFDGTEWRCDKNGTVFSSTNPQLANMGSTVLPEANYCGDRVISRTSCSGLSGAVLNDNPSTTLGIEYDWSNGLSSMGQTSRALVEINGQCWFRFNLNVAPSNYPNTPNTGQNIYTSTSPRVGTYAEYNASWGYYNVTNPDLSLGWATTPQFPEEGALYQWTAAMNGSVLERAQGACPTGFHVPSDCEVLYLEKSIVGSWNNELELINNVRLNDIGEGNPGAKLRGFGTSFDGDLNRSGFNILQTGYLNTTQFINRTLGYIWTSSNTTNSAIYRSVGGGSRGVSRWDIQKVFAFPVRCLRD